MKILAIETATDACSASLLIDDQCYTKFELAPRRHTQLILPQIEQVLAEADINLHALDAIAFGCGPGAFTGLRIAAGITQGLALAADIPAIAVSTLASIAQAAYQQYQLEKCYVALDARMDQVYWGEYQVSNNYVALKGTEKVTSPDDLQRSNEDGFAGIGSGWKVYQQALMDQVKATTSPVFQDIYPSAEQIAWLAAPKFLLGDFLYSDGVQPVYLRNKVAQTLIERGK